MLACSGDVQKSANLKNVEKEAVESPNFFVHVVAMVGLWNLWVLCCCARIIYRPRCWAILRQLGTASLPLLLLVCLLISLHVLLYLTRSFSQAWPQLEVSFATTLQWLNGATLSRLLQVQKLQLLRTNWPSAWSESNRRCAGYSRWSGGQGGLCPLKLKQF